MQTKHPPATRSCFTSPIENNDSLRSFLSGSDRPRPQPAWHRYSHRVVRRRSCFSCGEVQGGSGAFCNACGRPLDAPDLEFLSSDSTATTGNDVVMATGGGKGRSAVAIVAVLAALGGVAAFSGQNTTTATAKSTTTAVGRATSRTTSTLAASTTTTTNAPTTTTDAEAARARELALTQSRTIAAPILPEKTGTKLLLIGLTMAGSGQRGNAIVDLDSGVVTPYATNSDDDESIVQTYGSGLLVINTSYRGFRFTPWQPTGPTESVSALANNAEGFNSVGELAGDVFWSMRRNPLVSQGNVVSLVGHDVRDGHEVANVALPESTQLLGSDAANHPIVVDYGSGTYSFDPATKQFTRITSNMASAVRGDWQVERACTEQLVCSSILRHGTDPPRPIPNLNAFFYGPMSLAPDGQTVVQFSSGDGSTPTLEAVDLVAGSRQKLSMNADTYPMPLSWSTDGRWLFGPTNGVLSAWKVGTTETLQLTFDGDAVRVAAFGVFPS
jgi:hypothetical protein